MNEEEVNKEFSDTIREKLTEEQFWTWVESWKDTNTLCEEAENWDTKTKEHELIKLRKMLGDGE